MSRSDAPDPDWIGLSEASRMLGVSPATMRRWSDAGRVRVFTTPGGHRRARRDGGPELPWVLALTDDQRMLFRERGHLLAASVLQVLDATQADTAERHLKEASEAAADYGGVAARLGLSLSQTVEGFLRFRAPFHHELAIAARRRGFDAAETTDLLEAAERAMDRLLLATMTGHGAAAGSRPVIGPRQQVGVEGAQR